MLKEFKEFAMRGNVVDMAVGIIIGVAFGGIVNSLVNDILMPPIGLLIGDINFTDMFITLSGGNYQTLADAKAAGAATINYGIFINTLINFILVALALFLLIRQINRMRRKPEETQVPNMKECPFCATSIPARAVKCPQCTSPLQ